MKQMGCNSKLEEQCPCHAVSITLTSIRDFNSTTSKDLYNEVPVLCGRIRKPSIGSYIKKIADGNINCDKAVRKVFWGFGGKPRRKETIKKTKTYVGQ
jgi:hypothetical protein